MKLQERLCIVLASEKTDIPCNILSPDFLSFTIDTSLLLGGHWWGDSKKIVRGVAHNRVEKLDLANERLIAYARLLSPAMLRIGGTEADRVGYKPGAKAVAEFYRRNDVNEKTTQDQTREDMGSHEYILKKGLWKKVHEFLGKTGMSLLFTISAGLCDRDDKGAWQEENARKLITYSVKKKYRVAAWEFGNEVNGFPFIYGWKNRVTPAQYARDFAHFGHLVKSIDPQSRILGPASAVWPKIGEPYPIIRKLCKSPASVFLDAVSWHYYPQQSSRGTIATKRAGIHTMLSNRAANGILASNLKIHASLEDADKMRPNLSPVENWLTETGHALYGGEPGLSDTFVSTLWWVDELALLARAGVTKVFRQSLVGSDYGLLDQNSFEPRPDFFASFLWKHLMGTQVHIPQFLARPDLRLRAYLHSDADGKKATYLFVNLDRKKTARALIKPKDGEKIDVTEKYLLCGMDGIASAKISLNGIPVEDDLVFKWNKKKTAEKYGIRSFSGEEIAGDFSMPPLSILFLCTNKNKNLTKN